MGIELFGFFADTVGSEFVPLATDVKAAQVEHGLRTLEAPAHTRTLHAFLNEMPTSDFSYTRGDRVALGQIRVITHSVLVGLAVAADFVELFALLAA